MLGWTHLAPDTSGSGADFLYILSQPRGNSGQRCWMQQSGGSSAPVAPEAEVHGYKRPPDPSLTALSTGTSSLPPHCLAFTVLCGLVLALSQNETTRLKHVPVSNMESNFETLPNPQIQLTFC